MAGKITTILAKREAETYCRQGLHKEALRIYRNLLASAPNIDPAFKAGIENRIEKISAGLASDDLEEANRLTTAEIMQVKKGWGKEATESDMLICAQAFYQIGNDKEALIELEGMLRKGYAIERSTRLLAGCLVRTGDPRQAVATLETLSRKFSSRLEDQFGLVLMVAEEMAALKEPHHAKAVWNHLRKYPVAAEGASKRLAALKDSLFG